VATSSPALGLGNAANSLSPDCPIAQPANIREQAAYKIIRFISFLSFITKYTLLIAWQMVMVK